LFGHFHGISSTPAAHGAWIESGLTKKGWNEAKAKEYKKNWYQTNVIF